MNARRSVLVSVAAVATLLSACSSSSSPTSSTTTTTRPVGKAASCAWPTKANRDVTNVAYPDTGATYWAQRVSLEAGEHLELRGRFPTARYFSFITYGPSGGPIDLITDRDIEPDTGSTNPFGDGGDAGGSYTVSLTTDETDETDEPNTVQAVAGGTVIYRVYLSGTGDDATGGEGLPDVSAVAADGGVTELPTCEEPGANPAVSDLVAKNGPATDRPAPSQPVFIRPEAGVANLYPNPDNTYVATIVHHEPGRVVVLRAKAPTFPDTGAGAPVTGGEQVRYWSLCSDEYRKPYPVTACVADQDVALDAQGRYTIVVSTREDRPKNATAGDGVTWLDWGSTEVDNLLLMRQMLPADDFAEAAAKVEPGALAATAMGPYAPAGAYCSAADFEAIGADGCLAG